MRGLQVLHNEAIINLLRQVSMGRHYSRFFQAALTALLHLGKMSYPFVRKTMCQELFLSVFSVCLDRPRSTTRTRLRLRQWHLPSPWVERLNFDLTQQARRQLPQRRVASRIRSEVGATSVFCRSCRGRRSRVCIRWCWTWTRPWCTASETPRTLNSSRRSRCDQGLSSSFQRWRSTTSW
jgi:hypothetical protein